MPPKTITIIGSLNTDLVTLTPRVPTGGETLTATSFTTGPGGKGANQAVACARLSRFKPHYHSQSQSQSKPSSSGSEDDQKLSVKMIGAVGGDEFGAPLIKSLKDDGVDISGIKVVENTTTGVAVILVEQSTGENRILLNPGANHSQVATDFITASALGTPLPDLIILQLEIPLETVLQIIRTAREAGVDVLLNPAPAVKLPEEVYRGLKHLIVNESEAAILAGRKVEDVEVEGFNWDSLVREEFLQRGVENVVVTLGAKGAFCMGEKMEKGVYVQAEMVEKVVDTTAAGDTFVGAYAVRLVEEGRREAREGDVRWACRAAGRTVEKEGAQSAIPWKDEVDS